MIGRLAALDLDSSRPHVGKDVKLFNPHTRRANAGVAQTVQRDSLRKCFHQLDMTRDERAPRSQGRG